MKEQANSDPLRIGFIAQEMNVVFPEFVSYDKDNDIYSLNYAGLSVIAIKAIQEQQKIIEELKAQLASEKMERTKEIDRLSKQVEELMIFMNSAAKKD